MKSQGIQGRSRRPLHQAGQALIESVLVVPLLVALVFGAIELGRYAYLSILVGNAAEAGSLYGSQSLSDAMSPGEVQTAVQNDFQNNGQATSGLTVTSWVYCGCDSGGTISYTYGGKTRLMCTPGGNPALDPTCNNGAAGHFVDLIKVQASYTFHPLFSYPWIPTSLAISRNSKMRVANTF